MKAPETYYAKWFNGEYKIMDLIKIVQKDAYNQALEDAAENAICEYESECWTGNVDKESILELKK